MMAFTSMDNVSDRLLKSRAGNSLGLSSSFPIVRHEAPSRLFVVPPAREPPIAPPTLGDYVKVQRKNMV